MHFLQKPFNSGVPWLGRCARRWRDLERAHAPWVLGGPAMTPEEPGVFEARPRRCPSRGPAGSSSWTTTRRSGSSSRACSAARGTSSTRPGRRGGPRRAEREPSGSHRAGHGAAGKERDGAGAHPPGRSPSSPHADPDDHGSRHAGAQDPGHRGRRDGVPWQAVLSRRARGARPHASCVQARHRRPGGRGARHPGARSDNRRASSYTYGHSTRVSLYAGLLGERIGLEPWPLAAVRRRRPVPRLRKDRHPRPGPAETRPPDSLGIRSRSSSTRGGAGTCSPT